MTTHDAINAIFEGGGALFLCLNIRRLLKDRSVKGVSLLTTSWWTAWGFWNVYFYAAVSCSASFWAGIAVVLANFVWLCLAVWFARHPDPARGRECEVAMAPGVYLPGDWYKFTVQKRVHVCGCAGARCIVGRPVFRCTLCGGARS